MDEMELRRLRFSDLSTEQEFQSEYGDRAVRHVRLMTALVACIIALFGATLTSVAPDLQTPLLILRYGVMCPLLLVCLGLTWWRGFKPRMQPIMSIVMLVLGLDVIASMAVRAGMWPGHGLAGGGNVAAGATALAFAPADLMIVVLSIYTLARLRWVVASAIAWIVIGLYVASTLALGMSGTELARYYYELLFTNLLGMSAALSLERYVRRDFAQSRLLQKEHERAERLLLNILPGAIAQRLKRETSIIADHFGDVTVLFADIEGFSKLSEDLPAADLVHLLNDLFTCFDALAEQHGLEKIKTIGDAYMAASGLPNPRDDHAAAAADMALAMRHEVRKYASSKGMPLSIRIGLNSGSVVAGVIGTKKFIYDLWGDAVNTASRMESHGPASGIQLTEATYALLKENYNLTSRGTIPIKGKGPLPVYLLDGPKASEPENGESIAGERVAVKSLLPVVPDSSTSRVK